MLLLADAGFCGYAGLLTASTPAPGNALINQDNPDMTDALLAHGRQALLDRGIAKSGAAVQSGIGAMTDARWGGFLKAVSAQGVYPAGMDPRRAYTLRLVGGNAAAK